MTSGLVVIGTVPVLVLVHMLTWQPSTPFSLECERWDGCGSKPIQLSPSFSRIEMGADVVDDQEESIVSSLRLRCGKRCGTTRQKLYRVTVGDSLQYCCPKRRLSNILPYSVVFCGIFPCYSTVMSCRRPLPSNRTLDITPDEPCQQHQPFNIQYQ